MFSLRLYLNIFLTFAILFISIIDINSFDICDNQNKPLVPCKSDESEHDVTHVICDNYGVN